MRACLVVVDKELLEHSLQVAGADEQVVEHVPAACSDEPLPDGVSTRRLVRKAHDFHAFRAEDLIEAGGELAVPITKQVAGLHDAILQLPGQVPGLLGHPLAGGVGGDAGEVCPAAGDLSEEEDSVALQFTCRRLKRRQLELTLGGLPHRLAKGSPPAPDQIAVPAEQRLRLR